MSGTETNPTGYPPLSALHSRKPWSYYRSKHGKFRESKPQFWYLIRTSVAIEWKEDGSTNHIMLDYKLLPIRCRLCLALTHQVKDCLKCHTVDWESLFEAMGNFGICEGYIRMVKLMFKDTYAMVNINRQPSQLVHILEGSPSRMSLAPYLFLIVREVLNHMVKHAYHTCRVGGVRLPISVEQQVIA